MIIYHVVFFRLTPRVERLNIDIARNYNLQTGHDRRSYSTYSQATYYSLQTGHLTVVPIARIPRRVVVTATGMRNDPMGTNSFSGIVDVLLVPVSFTMQTCLDLYLTSFNSSSGQPYIAGTPSLRDQIFSLRRIAFHGVQMVCVAKQWDISEEIRNRLDYRLVITCPAFYTGGSLVYCSLSLLLEMEF